MAKANRLTKEMFSAEDIENFENQLVWNPETGCMLWGGRIGDTGYGWFYSKALRKELKAHRVSWAINSETPLNEELVLDHKLHCDRRCCAVHHLRQIPREENTKSENISEAGRKAKVEIGKNLGKSYAGAVHGMCHLNDETIITILRLKNSKQSQKSIAEEFTAKGLKISQTYISELWNRKKRKDLYDIVYPPTAQAAV